MSSTTKAAVEAESIILENLVNALLAEELFPGHAAVELLSSEEWERLVREELAMAEIDSSLPHAGSMKASMYRWHLDDESQAAIVIPVYESIIQPYRFNGSSGVYELRHGEDEQTVVTKIGAMELMRQIAALYADDKETVDSEGAERFRHMLAQALEQAIWSMEGRRYAEDVLQLPSAASLLELERKAAMHDRPFHPVSNAKLGWTQEECRRYKAEFSTPITLGWMAVKRDYLVSGREESMQPAELLLTEEEQRLLREELASRGLDEQTYEALPVHPWQMSAVLPRQLKLELSEGICVPLRLEAGTFYASSSIRSLMSGREEHIHIKLPLGVQSLGAVRYLSAIKLMNGQRAERLMRQALLQDKALADRLFLCDESYWWAYLPESRDLFADYPRHLSAMARQYPSELTEDGHVRLIPMSALAANDGRENGHLFDEWLRIRGLERNEAAVLRLFREALLPYYEVCFRLFRLGMMPEAHGQNSVLIWRQGRMEGLLLRDHDALRVHVPWLQANGLEDPKYGLRPGVPESLYHQTPQKLLSYFQTLGIQVNSYAILNSLSRHYGIEEYRLWLELRNCLEQAMILAELPSEVVSLLHEELFEKEAWPWKQIIRPLVKRQLKVPGSMPSGLGEVQNPFRAAVLHKNTKEVRSSDEQQYSGSF